MTLPTNMPNEYSGTEQGVLFNARSTTAAAIDLSAQMDATPLNPVGCVTRYNGNLYRYVYLASGTTVKGAPAYWVTTKIDPSLGLFHVAAANASTADDNCFAGVFLAAAITVARYIWIQVAGVNSDLHVDDGAAIGERLVVSSSDTFTHVNNTVSGPNLAVGVVTEAEGGTTSGICSAIILGPAGF
jgi:hypothetical protein